MERGRRERGRDSARTVRNIRHVEVVRHIGSRRARRIVAYEVELKIHFEYEGS